MEYMQEVRRIQKTESGFERRHLKYDQMVVCILSRSDVGRGINTVKEDI